MSPTLELSGTVRKGLVERACFADSQPWWSGDARVPALVVFEMTLRGCEQLVVLHVPDRLGGRPSRNAGQVHDRLAHRTSGQCSTNSESARRTSCSSSLLVMVAYPRSWAEGRRDLGGSASRPRAPSPLGGASLDASPASPRCRSSIPRPIPDRRPAAASQPRSSQTWRPDHGA